MPISKNKREQQAHITISAHYRHISRVRDFINSVAQIAPIDEDAAYDIVLATVEAVTNAIRHAGTEQVVLEVVSGSDCITVRIIDQGQGFGFHPDKFDFPSLEEQGGRGLPLMRQLMDELIVKSEPGRGTEVILVKKLTGAKNGSRPKSRAANA